MFRQIFQIFMMVLSATIIPGQAWSQDDVESVFGTESTLPLDDATNRDVPEELPPGDAEPDETDASPVAPRIQEMKQNGGSATELTVETIRERFPSGKIKIEREVTQDKDQNYVDHGSWKEWDEQENPIAGGVYQSGRREGSWFRWYNKSESDLFSQAPFHQFNGPFKSVATFRAGVLHGTWTIVDADDRKLCSWQFANGRRHGVSTWYYLTTQPMREIHYQNGELHGALTEWDQNGDKITEVEYINGRRHEKVSTAYEDGQKKSEGMVLRARYALQKPDEWWTIQLARYSREGKDERHGTWRLWYPGGQLKMEGEYQFNEPSGQFIWYHENGQKVLESFYSAGGKDGVWTWWHPNGQKSIQGAYVNGSPAGRWTWWHETGKVAQRVDYPASLENGRVLMQTRKK
jgi:antitoxin component YwqK of YwqJK toxin-antitoxin module